MSSSKSHRRLFSNGCCCWRNLSTAATAAGVFTMVTSLVQILLQTAIFTGSVERFVGQPVNIFNTSGSGGRFSVEQTVYILYIVLAAADLLLVVFSIIMLFGVEPEKKPSRRFYSPWLAFLPLYMIYESAINIYFFYMAWTARLQNRDTFIMRAYGFLIVPLAYWVVKEITNLVFWLAVIGRVREIDEMRNYDDNAPYQSSLDQPAVSASSAFVAAQRPPASAYSAGPRGPPSLYQAPRSRDFFAETTAHPDYFRRAGFPRHVVDQGGAGNTGPRPYVAKSRFTVAPRY